jgi:hypothetical protein
MAVHTMTRSDGTKSQIPQNEVIRFQYNASSVDHWIYIADADYEVVSVKLIPNVAGTDGSAVTADVMKASGTTAVSSGATVCSAADSLNLKGTINTLQTGTLSGTQSAIQLTAGDRLGVNFTGTLTAAVGLIQVELKRVLAPGSSI